MKWMRGLLAGALLGVLLVTAVRAQRQPIKSDNARFGDPTSTGRIYQDYLFGVIKSLNSNEMVLTKTQYGLDKTFKLERKTKYIHDGRPSSFDRLKVGDQVWVDVKKNKKTGEMIARKVVTGVGATD